MVNQNTQSGTTRNCTHRRVVLIRWDEWALVSTGVLPAIKTGRKARDKSDLLYTGSGLYPASHIRPDYARCPV